jgi:hypothetical protein
MPTADTNDDADAALALRALAWVLGEGTRADRLLALTGLDAAALRARLGDPAMLAAVLGFLEAHEPDLMVCAADLGVEPAALVRARRALEGA